MMSRTMEFDVFPTLTGTMSSFEEETNSFLAKTGFVRFGFHVV